MASDLFENQLLKVSVKKRHSNQNLSQFSPEGIKEEREIMDSPLIKNSIAISQNFNQFAYLTQQEKQALLKDIVEQKYHLQSKPLPLRKIQRNSIQNSRRGILETNNQALYRQGMFNLNRTQRLGMVDNPQVLRKQSMVRGKNTVEPLVLDCTAKDFNSDFEVNAEPVGGMFLQNTNQGFFTSRNKSVKHHVQQQSISLKSQRASVRNMATTVSSKIKLSKQNKSMNMTQVKGDTSTMLSLLASSHKAGQIFMVNQSWQKGHNRVTSGHKYDQIKNLFTMQRQSSAEKVDKMVAFNKTLPSLGDKATPEKEIQQPISLSRRASQIPTTNYNSQKSPEDMTSPRNANLISQNTLQKPSANKQKNTELQKLDAFNFKVSDITVKFEPRYQQVNQIIQPSQDNYLTYTSQPVISKQKITQNNKDLIETDFHKFQQTTKDCQAQRNSRDVSLTNSLLNSHLLRSSPRPNLGQNYQQAQGTKENQLGQVQDNQWQMCNVLNYATQSDLARRNNASFAPHNSNHYKQQEQRRKIFQPTSRLFPSFSLRKKSSNNLNSKGSLLKKSIDLQQYCHRRNA